MGQGGWDPDTPGAGWIAAAIVIIAALMVWAVWK
jgi:ABC-type uncharacterized transport system permease subunit